MSNTTKNVELNLLDISRELTGEDDVCHRSNMAVYIEYPDYEEKHSDEECKIVLQLDCKWGQPMRWVEMSADEARQLARILTDHAQRIISQSFEREPEDA